MIFPDDEIENSRISQAKEVSFLINHYLYMYYFFIIIHSINKRPFLHIFQLLITSLHII